MASVGPDEPSDDNNSDSEPKSSGPPEGANALSKLVWQATEWFGNAAATVQKGEVATTAPVPAGLGRAHTPAEALERLRKDYEKAYFISGNMDLDLYAEDCYFADDFAGFYGRSRFKSNLDNLTAFIVDSDVKLLSLQPEDDDDASDSPVVRSRCLVKLQLGLPWKPVLAWVWGVRHVFDSSGTVIVEHLESWEVTPQEGVRQLFARGPPQGLKQGKSP
jgi:hypothetical protein